MTRLQLTHVLDQLGKRGISRRNLAAKLGRSIGWIGRQESGELGVDDRCGEYAKGLIAAIDSVPVPDLRAWRSEISAESPAHPPPRRPRQAGRQA